MKSQFPFTHWSVVILSTNFYCTFQEVIHSMIHIKLVILVHVSVLDIYRHVKNQLGTRFPSCIPKNLGRFTCQREYCSPTESILEGQLCRTLRMSLGLPRRGLRRHKLFLIERLNCKLWMRARAKSMQLDTIFHLALACLVNNPSWIGLLQVYQLLWNRTGLSQKHDTVMHTHTKKEKTL